MFNLFELAGAFQGIGLRQQISDKQQDDEWERKGRYVGLLVCYVQDLANYQDKKHLLGTQLTELDL